MMIDLVRGKTTAEAQQLIDMFLAMIRQELGSNVDLNALGDAIALQGVAQMPARVKCAVLAWHTFQEAIKTGA
jgi:nitrogen fixation NifU-like protein